MICAGSYHLSASLEFQAGIPLLGESTIKASGDGGQSGVTTREEDVSSSVTANADNGLEYGTTEMQSTTIKYRVPPESHTSWTLTLSGSPLSLPFQAYLDLHFQGGDMLSLPFQGTYNGIAVAGAQVTVLSTTLNGTEG